MWPVFTQQWPLFSGPIFCISYCNHCFHKTPDRHTLRKEWFVLYGSVSVQSIEESGHTAFTFKEQGERGVLALGSFSPFLFSLGLKFTE